MNKQEILELKKTVAYLEKYLIQVSEERDKVTQQLKDSIFQTEDLKEKLKQESKSKSLLNQEIIQLRQEITTLNLKIFTQQEQSSQVFQNQEKSKQLQQIEIQRLLEILRMTNEESLEHRRHSLKLSKKIKILFKSIQLPRSCTKETLDPNQGIQKTKEFILKFPKICKENLRLHEENQQLFQKIEKIEFSEAAEFKNLVQDSNGLSFFKNKTKCGKQTCPANQSFTSNWIPKPIYFALEDFKSKNDAVTSNAVLSIFYKLNQMWQERENKRIQRIKQQFMARTNFSESHISMKTLKKNEGKGKTKEKIAKEYKNASDQMVNVISEYVEVNDQDSQSENTQNWLAESILRVLAEFTDKILVSL
jgi:hypothetical protein